MIKMRAIVPKGFREDAIYRRLEGAIERTMALAEKEFAKTYATWDHKPKWIQKLTRTAGYIMGEYYTVDQIYIWVSGGTKGPYPIPKKGPGLLVFPSGYRPKTRVRHVGSYAGGSYGEHVFVAGQVMHPGIKAREFDEAVRVYVEPWFRKWGEDAVKVGARESGHGA